MAGNPERNDGFAETWTLGGKKSLVSGPFFSPRGRGQNLQDQQGAVLPFLACDPPIPIKPRFLSHRTIRNTWGMHEPEA